MAGSTDKSKEKIMSTITDSGTGQELYKKAKKLIAGGTQLLSKRPEMFLPELWPSYYSKSKGCEVWDLDGNKFYDFTQMGVGTCVLGYSDDDINEAVRTAIEKGSMNTLNAPEEVELAELMTSLHPWADMVRYTRSGGEALSVAIRIARASSKKDKVMFCGYHGWHDWYLSANLADDETLDGHLLPGLEPNGVPRGLKGSAIPFNYNNVEEFLSIINEYKGQIGTLVLESIRNDEPTKEFVEVINTTCKNEGIVFVVDEVTAGFRINNGGAHLVYGLEPDIAVFAKGVSNGFPMGIILGKRDIMQAAQGTFISSTYWTDRIGPTAAIAAINKFVKEDVSSHLIKVGQRARAIWQSASDTYEVPISGIGGIYPLSHFAFDHKNPLAMKTLFTQLMLEEGFLATTALYASFAHKKEHLDKYEEAVNKTFKRMKDMQDEPEKFLKGGICHSGFKRLN